MNLDIRLSLGFFHHPKTLKLQKRAGIEAVVGLLRLWLWAAEQRSSGTLTDMDAEDIELAAEWKGDEGQLFKTLIECRWIDEKDGVYSLHGWNEHQQYASKSEERSAHARKAAEERWAKQKEQSSNAQPMPVYAPSIDEHTNSNAPETNNQLTNNQELKDTNVSLPETHVSDESGAPLCPQNAMLALYHEVLPELPRIRTLRKPLQEQVRTRWREKYDEGKFSTTAEGLEYFRGFFAYVKNCSFLMGKNKTSWTCDYRWIMKADHFDKITEGKYEDRA